MPRRESITAGPRCSHSPANMRLLDAYVSPALPDLYLRLACNGAAVPWHNLLRLVVLPTDNISS